MKTLLALPLALPATAAELPLLPGDLDPARQPCQARKDLGDGLQVNEPVIDFIRGAGAGDQYISIFPDQDIILATTSHNKGHINAPLTATFDHLLPLFTK
jgi:hypothetical protein